MRLVRESRSDPSQKMSLFAMILQSASEPTFQWIGVVQQLRILLQSDFFDLCTSWFPLSPLNFSFNATEIKTRSYQERLLPETQPDGKSSSHSCCDHIESALSVLSRDLIKSCKVLPVCASIYRSTSNQCSVTHPIRCCLRSTIFCFDSAYQHLPSLYSLRQRLRDWASL